MHHCEKFREQISDQIIDGRDLTVRPEIQAELLLCLSCSDFYTESRDMLAALSEIEFEISDQQLDAMSRRLRMRIVNDRVEPPSQRRAQWFAREFGVPALAALAAVLVITIGLSRIAVPVIESHRRSSDPAQHVLVDNSINLDPVTVSFLEQSELLLRNVMKLEPSDSENLEEAKQIAARHLMNINKRMEAASDIPPVLTLMDRYETILRDIRNLNDAPAAEDISDIQSRIEGTGLIANLKSFQPTVTVVEVEQ